MNDNKKLIKQLEGVGFVTETEGNGYMCLRSKNDDSFIRYVLKKGWLLFFEAGAGETNTSVYVSTFPQILAAIKEHTGVDLTPKKTKREEIDELKKETKALKEKTEMLEDVFRTTLEVPLKIMQDAIKSQNEVIEGLKVSEPLEVVKKITELALQLKRMEQSKSFDQGRMITEVHEGETVLSKVAKGEKKTFEVGDEVVVNENAKGLYGFQIEAMEKQTPLTIRKVIDTQPKGYECEYLDNHVGTFPAKWLDEHAPEEQEEKALEWGDFKIFNGEKVLVVHMLITTAVVYFKNGDWDEVNLSDLKPL